MRWSETVTLEFVKMYLKHECLWNPEHVFYKLRHHREKAYFEIISEFRAATSKTISVPEVKLKIKNLRTTYMQQVHKILARSSPDNIYEPSLIWFHEMDRCLKNVPTIRHSTYTTKPQAPVADSSSKMWLEFEETLNEKSDYQNPDPLVPPTDNECAVGHSEEVTIKKEHPNSFKKIKKKKFRHKSPVFYTQDSNQIFREDEFDIYGKFIASQLRQMDLQKALRLQLEIQSLVSEARLSEIT